MLIWLVSRAQRLKYSQTSRERVELALLEKSSAVMTKASPIWQRHFH